MQFRLSRLFWLTVIVALGTRAVVLFPPLIVPLLLPVGCVVYVGLLLLVDHFLMLAEPRTEREFRNQLTPPRRYRPPHGRCSASTRSPS